VVEIENVSVPATGKRELLPNSGRSPSKTFQSIKQAYGEDASG
jgi:hypothetical protein